MAVVRSAVTKVNVHAERRLAPLAGGKDEVRACLGSAVGSLRAGASPVPACARRGEAALGAVRVRVPPNERMKQTRCGWSWSEAW